MPRRLPRTSRTPAAPPLAWVAAAGLLTACTPRPDTPEQSGTAGPSVEDPPQPITMSSSGLPARALPTDGSAPTPPLRLTASDGSGLRLVSLDARASVQEPLAFTELHLTFENPNPNTIEGRFSIDLPPGAAISRFAMKIGDQWQEGEVVEQQAARAAYEDALHRKQDPALMEKEAGNRFSARVFPIPGAGQKELIVAYSQELTRSSEPYRLMLAGLPQLDQFDARILVDRPESGSATSIGGSAAMRKIIEVHERNHMPERDLEVRATTPQEAIGIRNDELALARVVVEGNTPPEAIGDLTILFDTSASRALDFGGQVRRLGALVEALREQEGAFRLRVAAFDQDISLLFDGEASDFGDAQLQELYSRRALGASDLASALRRASTITGSSGRLLLMTDGVATAGEDETAGILEAIEGLQRVGVTRLDAVIDGGLQDADTLEAITTAGLPHDGIVADARLPAARLAQKLRLATISGLELSVDGAAWSWPRVVDGVQPGDEVLVYAQLPKDAAMEVIMQGEDTVRSAVPLTAVDRPLLRRAWMGARIDAFQLQYDKLDPDKDAKSRTRLRKQIVELSTRNRVLSDFTALLVLETEADYRRFGIDRRSLADILVVGSDGLEWRRRSDGSGTTPAIPQMARTFDPASASDAWGGPLTNRPYSLKTFNLNDDEDVWGGLTGTEVGEAYGVGGLGLVGTGRGGGGVGEGAIGLGNTGLIGRGGGGASSGYGRGAGAGFGGRGRRIPRVRQVNAKVSGGMDKDIVRRIVRAHINEVRYCYNQGLARDPSLGGRVSIQFTIGPTGKVPVAVVAETTLRDKDFANCIAKAVKRWKFPKPSASTVQVTSPFVLSPSGGPARSSFRPPALPPLTREQHRAAQIEHGILAERARRVQAEAERAEREAERTLGSPYEGQMYDVMTLLDEGKNNAAVEQALRWKDDAPGDVVAHLALGEALEAQGQLHAAARAYGSLIDLFPSRADLRRHAGSRIESLGGTAINLAADTYAKAVEQRGDHPSSHRLLAFALLRAGEHEAAFDAAAVGASQVYPSGRFAGAQRILREDAGLIAAAWSKAEPERADEIRDRTEALGITIPTTPSTRFVMTWETDANDVDFHIRDGKDGHAYYALRDLPSGGRLYDDVTTGYGPECFTIEGMAQAFPYRFNAHYFSRGPMGYGMGTLQILEHDGKGTLYFDDRPYLIMKDRAEVKLGELDRPLAFSQRR